MKRTFTAGDPVKWSSDKSGPHNHVRKFKRVYLQRGSEFYEVTGFDGAGWFPWRFIKGPPP